MSSASVTSVAPTDYSGGHAHEPTEVSRPRSEYVSFVVFKVEDTLFRAPREVFQKQSSLFQGMFAAPVTDGDDEKPGDNDDNPLVLEDVTKVEFKSFLKSVLDSL